MAGIAPPPAKSVDRQTTTPFLLKLFYRNGSFHRLDDFAPTSVPASHLQIYTWPDLSLRELTLLLTSTLTSLRAQGSSASLPSVSAGTRLAFRLVYPDTRGAYSSGANGAPGRFMARDLGSVVVGESAQQVVDSTEAEKTLQDARFIIGDYVSCCVLPPLANGDVAPPPPSVGPAMPAATGNGPRAGRRGGGGGGGGYDGPTGYGRLNDYDADDRGYSRGGGRRGGDRYGAGGGGGGYGRLDDTNGYYSGSRGIGSSQLPAGDWRRGERVPEGPAASYGGGGGGGGGAGGGGYRGGRGRGRLY